MRKRDSVTFTALRAASHFLRDHAESAPTIVECELLRRLDNQQARRTGATAGLAALEKRGRGLLQILNSLILAQIGDNAQLRREWTSAKTVQQKPGPSATQPAATLMTASIPAAVSLSPAA
jgi:hypothetical protein